MFCKNCGKQLPDSAKVCSGCGAMVISTMQNRKPQMPKAAVPERKSEKLEITVSQIQTQVKLAPEEMEIKNIPAQEDIRTAPVQRNTPYIPAEEEIKTAPIQRNTPPIPAEEVIKTAPIQRNTPPIPVEEEIKTAPIQRNAPFVPAGEIKTAPIQRDIPFVPMNEELKTAPLEQEYRIYRAENEIRTAPVEREIKTAPLERNETAPVRRVNPVQEQRQNKPKQPAKRIRKLPILLGAIVMVILLAVFGDKKEEAKKPEPTVPEVKYIEIDPSKPRYDSENFLLSHEEYEYLYFKLLEENGIPVKSKGDLIKGDDFIRRQMVYNETWNMNFATHNMGTEKVQMVIATFFFQGKHKELEPEQKEALLLVYEAVHGPITEKDWDAFIEADKKKADQETLCYERTMDGLILGYEIHDEAVMAYVQIDKNGEKEETTEATEPEETKDASIQDTFPEGTLRFESKAFLFTGEEFVELLRSAIENENLPFTLDEPRIADTGKMHITIRHEGRDTGFMILERDPSGKVNKISYNYNLGEDSAVNEKGIESALTVMKTAHGGFTEKHWSIMGDTKPSYKDEDHTTYTYHLDGLKIMMRIRAERIYADIAPEE